MNKQMVRCAIYTRKSSDEGLDKEFNTLEAQREAGENYVKSQIQQGWVVVPEHYDDGGFSGGSLKRPALQRLLQDVKDGKVDMIVVYKIDRLTRSLLDFSELIKVLDENQCSFVSVTQHFNTCDSMGKLTLNILLSFAQFERELSSERIRDKIAATKKKGMWTGGCVPLGYDVVDKKLIVNESEAEVIRFIFNDYLKNKSERFVAKSVNRAGYTPKMRIAKNGDIETSPAFVHAMINKILSNPVYAGKVKYKTEMYDGQHEAIIPFEIWEQVQALKSKNRQGRFNAPRSEKNILLKGLAECGCCGVSLTSTRCKKDNKFYEYYTSLKAIKEGYDTCKMGSIPAGELDRFVVSKVQKIFQSPEIIQELVHQVKAEREGYGEREIFDIVQSIDKVFQYFSPATIQSIIKMVVSKIIVHRHKIIIQYNPFGIQLLPDYIKIDNREYNAKKLEFVYNVTLGRKQGRTIIVDEENHMIKPQKEDRLINALSQAFKWQNMMDKWNMTFDELSKREQVDKTHLGRILKLTFLAPQIIDSILAGTQPRFLKLEDFTRGQIPRLWEDQMTKFGFKTMPSNQL